MKLIIEQAISEEQWRKIEASPPEELSKLLRD
jgi:hypothetical protein